MERERERGLVGVESAETLKKGAEYGTKFNKISQNRSSIQVYFVYRKPAVFVSGKYSR